MNLKESYRYSNCLDGLLDTAQTYLCNKGFITTTEQQHLRSKSNTDASDETITVPKPYDVDFTPNDVIDFAVKILDEKEALANAIAVAKVNAEINIDNAIAMNKKRQSFVRCLTIMGAIRPTETQTQGSDYTFNVDKNQTKYYYPIKEVTSIDFNRGDVKALAKKYTKICDDISSKLDSIEINTVVDFDPKFDVNEMFEDAIAEMIER